ncbi:hypothetical protein, partial [Klebsiella pneumoniae]|uniref:hypothetical protein n=1 Tax=Klebsiella pneumoniae TaxID=573 RepID=UPI003F7F232E
GDRYPGIAGDQLRQFTPGRGTAHPVAHPRAARSTPARAARSAPDARPSDVNVAPPPVSGLASHSRRDVRWYVSVILRNCTDG